MPGLDPDILHHEHHVLRLYTRGNGLIEPMRAPEDGEMLVEWGLNVANEMGLWRRSDLEHIGRTVRLTLDGPGAGAAALALVGCEAGEEAEVGPGGGDGGIDLKLNERAKLQCTVRLRVRAGPVVLRAEVVPQGARAVMGVCSMPVFPPACGVQEEGAACVLRNAASACQCRRVPGPADLYVGESLGYLGIGGKVWDAALAVVDWFSEGSGRNSRRLEGWISGRHVLELGSGTGILGFALSALSSPRSFTMTDLPEVVQLLQFNLALNQAIGRRPGGPGADCELRCAAMPWGDAAAARDLLAQAPGGAPPETVLLSDTAYSPDLYRLLLATLCAICPPEARDKQRVLVAHRYREPDSPTTDFFAMLGKHFEIEALEFTAERGTGPQDLDFFQCVRKEACTTL